MKRVRLDSHRTPSFDTVSGPTSPTNKTSLRDTKAPSPVPAHTLPSSTIEQLFNEAAHPGQSQLLTDLHELLRDLQRASPKNNTYTNRLLLHCSDVSTLYSLVAAARHVARKNCASQYALLGLLCELVDQDYPSAPSLAVLLLACLPSYSIARPDMHPLLQCLYEQLPNSCPPEVTPFLADCVERFHKRFGKCRASCSPVPGVQTRLDAIKDHVDRFLGRTDATSLSSANHATAPGSPTPSLVSAQLVSAHQAILQSRTSPPMKQHRLIAQAAQRILDCSPLTLDDGLWHAFTGLASCAHSAEVYDWLDRLANPDVLVQLHHWMRDIDPDAGFALRRHVVQALGLRMFPLARVDIIAWPLMHLTSVAGHFLASQPQHPMADALRQLANGQNTRHVEALLRGLKFPQVEQLLQLLKGIYPPAAKVFAFVAAKVIHRTRKMAPHPSLLEPLLAEFPTARGWDWGEPGESVPHRRPLSAADLAAIARDVLGMALCQSDTQALHALAHCADEPACIDAILSFDEPVRARVLEALQQEAHIETTGTNDR